MVNLLLYKLAFFPDNKDNRGRVYHRERISLASLYGSADEEQVHQVIKMLADEQLLTLRYEVSSDEEIVEIAQEMLYEWPRLRQWLDDEASFADWYQAIDNKASQWFATNPNNASLRDQSRLLQEHELAEVKDWCERRECALNARQKDFIQASQIMVQEKQLRSHHEYAGQRYAMASSLVAQAKRVREQRADSLQLSTLLAAEAIQRYHLLEADQVLRDNLELLPRPVACLSHVGVLKTAVCTYNGSHFATLSSDGTAWIYARSEEEEMAQMLPIGEISSLALSFDGRYLVGVAQQKIIRVWETYTGQHVKDLPFAETLCSITFCSGEYYLLAAVCQDGSVSVWDLLKNQQYCSLPHAQDVNVLTFSADGCYLATISGSQTVKIWEWAKSRLVGQIRLKATIHALSFSSDANQVALACQNNRAEIWEKRGKRRVASLQHDGPVHAIVWSRNGRHIAAASDNAMYISGKENKATIQ